MHLAVRERANSDAKIDVVGIDFVQQPAFIGRVEAKADAGRYCAHMRQQFRPHENLDAVWKANAKNAIGCFRIELVITIDRTSMFASTIRTGSTRASARGVGCMPVALRVSSSSSNRVRRREIVAHGRLAESDTCGSLRDAPLRHQRVEGHQQVEIDPSQIDMIDSQNQSNLFA